MSIMIPLLFAVVLFQHVSATYRLNITCSENCETYVSNVIQTYTGAGQFISEPPAPYSANIIPILYDTQSSPANSTNETDDYANIELLTCRVVQDTPNPIPTNDGEVDDWGDDQGYTDGSYQKVTAEMAILFNNIKSIDMIAGTITVSVNLDILWFDQLLSWDADSAGSIYKVFIPQEWLWVPDITMLNAAEDFDSGVTQTDLLVHNNGLVWQSRPATISSSCMFDFSMFPFDTQTCELIFASTNYHLDQFNLELYPLDSVFMTAAGLARSSTFWSSEYDIVGITTRRELCYTIYGYVPRLIYAITFSRYTTYYYASAILPCISITVVALLALFIDDINSRLAVAITSLLAIMAVMWSVSDFLPVTSMVTWLSMLAMFCILIVFIVCVECCVVAYMQTLKSPVPRYARTIIQIGKFHHMFDDAVCWPRTNSGTRRDESSKSNDVALVSINGAASRSDDINSSDPPSVTPPGNRQSAAVDVECKVDPEVVNLLGSCDSDEAEREENRRLWKKVGSAIDRISRLVFSVAFSMFLLVHYSKLM